MTSTNTLILKRSKRTLTAAGPQPFPTCTLSHMCDRRLAASGLTPLEETRFCKTSVRQHYRNPSIGVRPRQLMRSYSHAKKLTLAEKVERRQTPPYCSNGSRAMTHERVNNFGQVQIVNQAFPQATPSRPHRGKIYLRKEGSTHFSERLIDSYWYSVVRTSVVLWCVEVPPYQA
jgi:hypothetical protein